MHCIHDYMFVYSKMFIWLTTRFTAKFMFLFEDASHITVITVVEMSMIRDSAIVPEHIQYE